MRLTGFIPKKIIIVQMIILSFYHKYIVKNIFSFSVLLFGLPAIFLEPLIRGIFVPFKNSHGNLKAPLEAPDVKIWTISPQMKTIML